MEAAVLFLDVDWQPLRVESWKRAMIDLVGGKIEVVHFSADKTVQGVNRTYPLPSVVRILRRFKRTRQAIRFSRINIYNRDGFICQYCQQQFDTEDLTFDHVVPRARGGKTLWDNIVTCCVPCNSAKGDSTPEEVGMKLLKKPKKPTYLPSVCVKMDRSKVPDEWAPYWWTTLTP